MFWPLILFWSITLVACYGVWWWHVLTLDPALTFDPVLTNDPGHVLWCVMLACFNPWPCFNLWPCLTYDPGHVLWCVMLACFDPWPCFDLWPCFLLSPCMTYDPGHVLWCVVVAFFDLWPGSCVLVCGGGVFRPVTLAMCSGVETIANFIALFTTPKELWW